MAEYDQTSSPLVYIHTASDSTQVAWPSTGQVTFSRAVRASTACTLACRFQGKRQRASETAHANDTVAILFAAGETRAVAVDLIKTTGSTLNSAVIEVYL